MNTKSREGTSASGNELSSTNYAPDQTTKHAKPDKHLPAARISTKKQWEILRAMSVANNNQGGAVSIKVVASIQSMHPNSISMCNPFFIEAGLITKQGHKFIPCKEVIDYAKSMEWDSDFAAHKLAPLIKNTWFANVVLLRLQMKPIKEKDAIRALAEESNSATKFKSQLVMLIDYLEFSGLLQRNNGMLEKPKEEPRDSEDTSKKSPEDPINQENSGQKFDENMEIFMIPIPGKKPARIQIPKELNDHDWQMLKTMLEAYIERLQSQTEKKRGAE